MAGLLQSMASDMPGLAGFVPWIFNSLPWLADEFPCCEHMWCQLSDFCHRLEFFVPHKAYCLRLLASLFSPPACWLATVAAAVLQVALIRSRERRAEDGGQSTEHRAQRTEDRGQRTEDRGRKAEIRLAGYLL